jgi:myo-inositol 2-dehydrogenase / D-chiro-inositol 1-dehydrogenase
VGCGRAASTLHAPMLARVPGAMVVALADRDPARLTELASRHPAAMAHTDYRPLLEDPRVDLVAVCVPAMLHGEVAIDALRAGKHVFIEKPLALSVAECDRIVAAAGQAEASGVRAAVGFNLRSHRLVRHAREIIASGELGEIELLRTLWTADWSGGARPAWHARRRDGGGALLEVGTHQADLWRWLLGSEVESVRACSRSIAFDDQTATFQARMASGVLVSSAVSQRSVSHNLIEVFGSRGSLRLSCYHADSLEVAAVGGRSRGAWRRIRPLLDKAVRLPAAVRPALGGGDFRLSYAHQWSAILAALADGGPMPASVQDGRQAAAVIDAALRSSLEDDEAAGAKAARTPREARAV